MVKIEILEDRIVELNTFFEEKLQDYVCKNTFVFESGKTYGLICEHGAGGETISELLSGKISTLHEKIMIDGKKVEIDAIKEVGWYVGEPIYTKKFLLKKELSKKQIIEEALKENDTYSVIDEIVEEFGLDPYKMDFGLSVNCNWEKWRASFAIGCMTGKKIFCFPWMNSMRFYDCMYNSVVYKLFRKVTDNGGIIILPSSREENVRGLVDVIVKINNPRFEKTISNSSLLNLKSSEI